MSVLAIPSFARKYQTSCSTCHESFPKRNAFGEAFRRSGYFLPIDDKKNTKDKQLKLGADEWKALWPEAVWPGEIPMSFPLAVYSQMRVNKSYLPEEKGKSFDFNMPRDLVLLFGGSFNRDVAFFGEWAAFNEGVNGVGLFRLFMQFNHITGDNDALRIRIGKFEPGITDGYPGTQKITLSFPNTLSIDPTGFWKAQSSQSGIEVNGIVKHRWYYAVGMVNGESKTTNDPSDQKDIYGRVSYQFDGMGYDLKDTSESNAQAEETDRFFNLGAYSYYGSKNNIVQGTKTYSNRFYRYGIDGYFHYEHLDIISGLIFGKDANPANLFKPLTSSAFFVEGALKVFPWLTYVLRIENNAVWYKDEEKEKYWGIIPNITVLYRPNVRFTLESYIRINRSLKIPDRIIAANNLNPVQNVTLNSLIAF